MNVDPYCQRQKCRQ